MFARTLTTTSPPKRMSTDCRVYIGIVVIIRRYCFYRLSRRSVREGIPGHGLLTAAILTIPTPSRHEIRVLFIRQRVLWAPCSRDDELQRTTGGHVALVADGQFACARLTQR